jgi:hypothetical protein
LTIPEALALEGRFLATAFGEERCANKGYAPAGGCRDQ